MDVFGLYLKAYSFRRDMPLEEIQKVYTVVWDQCSEEMKDLVTAITEFKKIKGEIDTISLLNLIRADVYNFEGHKYQYNVLIYGKRNKSVFRHTTSINY